MKKRLLKLHLSIGWSLELLYLSGRVFRCLVLPDDCEYGSLSMYLVIHVMLNVIVSPLVYSIPLHVMYSMCVVSNKKTRIISLPHSSHNSTGRCVALQGRIWKGLWHYSSDFLSRKLQSGKGKNVFELEIRNKRINTYTYTAMCKDHKPSQLNHHRLQKAFWCRMKGKLPIQTLQSYVIILWVAVEWDWVGLC